MESSKSLSLLYVFCDFFPMGYSIVRNGDITAVRHGTVEQRWHAMYKGERLLDGFKLKFRPDLSSMEAAIWSVASQYQYMTVQCEDESQAIADFYLGGPVAMAGESLLFEHFNVLGEWDRNPSVIDLSEVTVVEFDTPYIRHFSNYVRPRPMAGSRKRSKR